MSDLMTPHCAVCGREQSEGEQWEMFVEQADGERHLICSTECLIKWAGGEAQDPQGIFT